MKPITLRDIPPKVQKAIRKEAAREEMSLNKAVNKMLNEYVEQKTGTKTDVVYDDLESLFGAWSPSESAQFSRKLKKQRRVDRELWD